MRFLLLALLTLFTTPAFATFSETIRWRSLPNGKLEFWSFRREAGFLFVDKFEKKPGEFQDLREHLAFTSPEAAQAKFDELTKGFEPGKPPLALLHSGPQRRLTGQIWRTRQNWSWEWEKKFAKWVQEETSADYFKRNRVSTDCADAAFAFRWIFSRINGLPAAAHLGVSEDLFTSDSVLPAWENLPTASRWQDDRRFRAALDYLLRNTYTHTLMRDLYPIKISREATLPGTVFLHLYSAESGHTEWLYQVKGRTHPAPLRILASTIPREVRELAEYGILDWGSPPTPGESGLLRFRWAVKSARGWSMTSASSMPNYSLEQYGPDFTGEEKSFVDAVTRRVVPNWNPDLAAAVREKAETLKDRLKDRVKIVNDGFDYCQSHNGCPEGSASWENWSTPSRDAAIGRVVSEIVELTADEGCDSRCMNAYENMRRDVVTRLRGTDYTMGQAFDVWSNGNYKSDPNLPVAERWGL